MFPAPEKVSAPGLNAEDKKLGTTAEHLLSKLQAGKDCAEEVMGYLVSGGPPANQLVWSCLGNRLVEPEVKGCPLSLLTLLTMKGDPNVSHPRVGPALCWAARMGNADIVEKLADCGANLEALDPDGGPALKAAIVCGAAPAAMMLIRKGANVHWKHHDGATLLHIMISWLCDPTAAGANKRIPPNGDEPSQLVKMLVQYGIDPTVKQKWEGRGLSAVDTWRARKDESPWLHDDRTFSDFEKAAKEIHTLFIKTSDAMEQKVSANNYLKEKNYERALNGYATARETLTKAGIEGHHMATLWSNEANTRRQQGDIDGARNACEEGLKIPEASEEIKKKLQYQLDKCNGKVEEKQEVKPTVNAGPQAQKASKTKMKDGFMDASADGLGYGEEGSKQGQMPQFYQQPINGGEAVINVPINQPGQRSDKMQIIQMPEVPEKDDDDYTYTVSDC